MCTSSWVPEESNLLGAGIARGFELSCGCWEQNLGPGEEQAVLSTDEQMSPAPRTALKKIVQVKKHRSATKCLSMLFLIWSLA